MKLFECQACDNTVFFENSTCVECGHRLGFLDGLCLISALEPAGDQWLALAEPSANLKLCANCDDGGCNWLIPADSSATLCACCKHNQALPDLSNPKHVTAWRALEQAKRHLFYSLMRWRLPIPDRTEDPSEGLAFEFLADVTAPDGTITPVLTGHDHGIITLNISEADDAEREARRMAMGEPYRTLIGHFRHEIGHYYWDRLVRDGPHLQRGREVFGDERSDYGEALQRHYRDGAPPNWRNNFISSYASCHPWEDFAETWAHYMHMVDALETAHAFGLRLRPRDRATPPMSVPFDPYTTGSIDDLVRAWVPVTVALNSINRSLGQPDLYPFVLPDVVVAKFAFIHDIIRKAPEAALAPAAPGMRSQS